MMEPTTDSHHPYPQDAIFHHHHDEGTKDAPYAGTEADNEHNTASLGMDVVGEEGVGAEGGTEPTMMEGTHGMNCAIDPNHAYGSNGEIEYGMEYTGENGGVYENGGATDMNGAAINSEAAGEADCTGADSTAANGDGGNPEADEQQEREESETADAERAVKRERKDTINNTAHSFKSILEDIQRTTNRLLNEVDTYLKTTESVRIDYIRCMASQEREAQRIDEMQPDVAGATASFLQQAQMQAMMVSGAGNPPGGRISLGGM